MKPYIDLQASYTNLFLSSKKLKSRLRRYWGTEWKYDPVAGENVEVLRRKFYIYPGTHTKRVQMIAKMFGIWHQIKDEKFKDIDEYWLFLNPNKVTNFSKYERDLFINKVNLFLDFGEPFEVKIGLTDTRDPGFFQGMEEQELRDYLDTRLDSQAYSNLTLTVLGDSITKEAIAAYAFVEGADEFFTTTVKDVKITPIWNPPTYHPLVSRLMLKPGYYTSALEIVVEVVQHTNITEDSTLANIIYNDRDPLHINKMAAVKESDSDVLKNPNTIFDYNGYLEQVNPTADDQIWLGGQLRMSTFNSHIMDRDLFADLISQSLDSDYEVEEDDGGFFGGFFGKILSIVLVVAAVYVAWTIAPVAAGASLAVYATFLGTLSLTLTIAQLAMSMMGIQNSFTQMFGKIIQVVQVLATITGITSFMQKAALTGKSFTQMIKDQVTDFFTVTKKAFAEAASKSNVITSVFDDLTLKVSEGLSGMLPEGRVLRLDRVFSVGAKVVTAISDMRYKSKVEGLQGKLDSLNDKIADVQEDLNELNDQEIHLGVEDIRWSTQPLTVDWQMYDTNHLYEGTVYNVGRPSFISVKGNERDKEYLMSKTLTMDMFKYT